MQPCWSLAAHDFSMLSCQFSKSMQRFWFFSARSFDPAAIFDRPFAVCQPFRSLFKWQSSTINMINESSWVIQCCRVLCTTQFLLSPRCHDHGDHWRSLIWFDHRPQRLKSLCKDVCTESEILVPVDCLHMAALLKHAYINAMLAMAVDGLRWPKNCQRAMMQKNADKYRAPASKQRGRWLGCRGMKQNQARAKLENRTWTNVDKKKLWNKTCRKMR